MLEIRPIQIWRGHSEGAKRLKNLIIHANCLRFETLRFAQDDSLLRFCELFRIGLQINILNFSQARCLRYGISFSETLSEGL